MFLYFLHCQKCGKRPASLEELLPLLADPRAQRKLRAACRIRAGRGLATVSFDRDCPNCGNGTLGAPFVYVAVPAVQMP